MEKLSLEIIALSNYADFSKDGKLSIMGIFDEIYSEKFPSTFLRSFLAFTVKGTEPDSLMSLEVEILSPKQIAILKKHVNFKVGPNGKGNFVIQIINLELPEEGRYKILVKNGKDILGSTELNVGLEQNGHSKKTN